jgi:acetyl-CoA carboxylase beta subunit
MINLSNDFNKPLNQEVNKKIDMRLWRLARDCKNAIYHKDFDNAYEIMRDIEIWEEIRGSEDNDINLKYIINGSFNDLVKYFRDLEDGRIY